MVQPLLEVLEAVPPPDPERPPRGLPVAIYVLPAEVALELGYTHVLLPARAAPDHNRGLGDV